MSLGYAPGRDESRSDRLTGLGDVDDGARVHLLGSYVLGRLHLGIDASKDIGGSKGVLVRPSASVRIPVSTSVSLSAGAAIVWADERHTNAFFGVSAAQAAQSGLPVYDAGPGFKRVDLDLGASWMFALGWVSRFSVGADQLLGSAADRPVTERKIQPVAGIMIGYRF